MCPGRRVSTRGFPSDRLLDDRFQVAGHVRAELSQPRRLRLHHLADQGLAGRLVECRTQRHHLVQGQAQRVYVRPSVTLPLEPLRGHVANRPHDVAGVCQIISLDGLGQSKVGNPGGPVSIEQKIGGFNVTVADTLRVGVLQGAGNLLADPRHAPPVTDVRSPCR